MNAEQIPLVFLRRQARKSEIDEPLDRPANEISSSSMALLVHRTGRCWSGAHSCTCSLPQFPAGRTWGTPDTALAAAHFTDGFGRYLSFLRLSWRREAEGCLRLLLRAGIQEEKLRVPTVRCSAPCRDLPMCHDTLNCFVCVLSLASFF